MKELLELRADSAEPLTIMQATPASWRMLWYGSIQIQQDPIFKTFVDWPQILFAARQVGEVIIPIYLFGVVARL